MTTNTQPTPRRELRVYLSVKPSTAQTLKGNSKLWRYAFKRSDGNWRMGVVDADSRENAGWKLQGANPTVHMLFRASLEGMRYGND